MRVGRDLRRDYAAWQKVGVTEVIHEAVCVARAATKPTRPAPGGGDRRRPKQLPPE